jgi:gas vesicle protein
LRAKEFGEVVACGFEHGAGLRYLRCEFGSAEVKFNEAAASTKSVAEQALSAGQDLKEKAKDLAGSSTDALKDHASDLVDAAKDVASQATDKLKEAVNDR